MGEVKTICSKDYPDACSLTVEVENGRITLVRGGRGIRLIEYSYAPARAENDFEDFHFGVICVHVLYCLSASFTHGCAF
jgi:hypothetical protein